MKREIVTILVVVLFFGLALAPSINANVSKQDDLVELDVEFCGLGKKHTVKLTQEEYDEVELILNDLQGELYEVESDEETVKIIKQGFIKLNKFNIFGDIGVEEAIKLVTKFSNSKEYNEKISDLIDSYVFNIFCFVFGKLDSDLSFTLTPLSLIISVFFIYLSLNFEERFFNLALALQYLISMKPLHFFSLIVNLNFFALSYSEINSIGLLGVVKTDNSNLIFGFSGIKILFPGGNCNQFFFGTALAIFKIQ